MRNDEFFEDPKEQSLVKVEIVRKYFWAWAKVIIPWAKQRGKDIAYVDLFCGPGSYSDGTESTPIHILKTALREPDLQRMLRTWFNDKNPAYVLSLQNEIKTLPDISQLRKPKVTNEEVGVNIITAVKKSTTPTLYFVDPWGYNGLSLDLINSALENWGCECIFFFNYNRINAAFGNPVLKENMASLFGEQRASVLTKQLTLLSSSDRELAIIEAISEALNEPGHRYVLPFRFKPTAKTSHHLIFVTKNVKGYEIMKEIMAKESSSAPQGMAAFEYNPATQKQPLLFALSATLDDLGEMLLSEFAGQTRSMKEIYEAHHVGRPFVERNYKHALGTLETDGKITADPPAKARRKGTFGENVQVTFPSRNRS